MNAILWNLTERLSGISQELFSKIPEFYAWTIVMLVRIEEKVSVVLLCYKHGKTLLDNY